MRNPFVMLVAGLVIGLIIAAGAFIGGMNMGQAQAQDQQNQFFAQRGFNPNAAGGAAGGAAAGQFGGAGAAGAARAGAAGRAGTAGTIKKIDGNTITLTVPNSEDITVSLPANATIIKTVTGTVSDLKEGQRLTVEGTRSGNNVAATAVQVTDLPAGVNFAGFGGGRAGARATPTPGQ